MLNLTAQLAQLERVQLVNALRENEAAYSFKHALLQETAYATLLKHQRKRLHQLVAASIEENFPHALNENAARLAEHFWLAEEWARAAEYSLRAGTQALRVYALREAMNHFERALAALEQTPMSAPLDQYEALMGWAEAAAKFRPFAEQLEHLARAEQIARTLNDKPRLARALYRIGGVHTAEGHNMRAGEPLAECFMLANELGDERLTIIPTYFMGMATLDSNPRAAIPLFERAIELAQRYNESDIETVSNSAKAWAFARVGEFANASAAIARGQALLSHVKSPMVASDVDLFTGWAYFEMNDAERGLMYGQRGLDKARAAENLDCVCGAYLCVGFNQLTTQRLPEAQAAFQEAIRESKFSGATVFENVGRAGLAMTQFYGGRSDAVSDVENAHTRAIAMGDVMGRTLTAQALGEMYARGGDAARAETFLNDALEFFHRNQMKPALARTLETLARVYAMSARPAEAEHARAQARQWQDGLQNEWNEVAREN